jgi:hypothetical protein
MKEANVYCLSAWKSKQRLLAYILLLGRYADCVWDHQCSHFLVDSLDLVEWQYDLPVSNVRSSTTSTHIGDPAKDVGVEA